MSWTVVRDIATSPTRDRVRQEDHESEASLQYIATPRLPLKRALVSFGIRRGNAQNSSMAKKSSPLRNL